MNASRLFSKPLSVQTFVRASLIYMTIFSSYSFAETGLVTTSNFVSGYRLFDDGNSILYSADGASFEQSNLYQKTIRGGTDLKLSNILGATGDVTSFAISPDENTVVFQGQTSCCDANDVNELYSVSIEGESATKLVSLSPFPAERITSYVITPDSKQVIYLTIAPDGFTKQLYTVSINDGSLPVTLGSASEFIGIGYISPDSLYRVFVEGSFENNFYSQNLFKMDLSNGNVEKLNDDFVGDGFIDFPLFSADGQTVVYDARSTVVAEQGIFAVGVSSGDPVKLNPELVVGGNVSTKFIDQSGQFVYYIADQVVDNQKRLFRVPIGGGPSVEIINNFFNGESLSGDFSTQFSSDGTHAVFTIDLTDPVRHLYSVSLQTGVATKLNSAGRVLRFELSEDGQFAVFYNDAETPDVFELYSVPIAGGTAVKLNSDFINFANVNINYSISPDSKRLVYWADIDGDFKNEILEVPIIGGPSKQLSPDLQSGSDVGFPQYNDDGSIVLFRINEFEGVFSGLYAFDFNDVSSDDEEVCFPVVVETGGAAIICL